ncbi:hypothetical protein L218DRAFT_948336 [Marasmius fiardii PR-910]|nr:hypothetical protein L218DRAFT_948336 [Marasmius fiardii PR-910]
MNVRLLASGFGLALTIGDIFLCRREEKKFLSTVLEDTKIAQVLYILCRYITLIFQILDVAIFSFDSHKSAIASKLFMHPCLFHGVFHALTIYVVFSLLHAILSLRVYALYGRSLRAAFLFGLVAVVRVLIGIYDIASRLKDGIGNHALVAEWFDHLCFPTRSFRTDPRIVVGAGVTVYSVLPHSEKDHAFGGGMVIPGFFSELGVEQRRTDRPLECNWTMIAVTSYLGCHAIVGMHRLGDLPSSKASDEVVFSTVNTTWDSQTHIDASI